MTRDVLQVEMCRGDDDPPMDFQLCAPPPPPNPKPLLLNPQPPPNAPACHPQRPPPPFASYADTRLGEAERLLAEGLQAFEQQL